MEDIKLPDYPYPPVSKDIMELEEVMFNFKSISLRNKNEEEMTTIQVPNGSYVITLDIINKLNKSTVKLTFNEWLEVIEGENAGRLIKI